MPELSVVADLVWRVAAVEARRGGARLLSVDHVLVGLLSLEKLLDPSAGLDAARRELVRADHEIIQQLLARLNQHATVLRRVLRRQSPPGAAGANLVIHRDAACRAVFERASQIAQEHGSVACGALHLLAAVLESPPASLLAALPAYAGRSPVERLHRWALDCIRSAAPGALAPQPLPEPQPLSEQPAALLDPLTPQVWDFAADGPLGALPPRPAPLPGQPPAVGQGPADQPQPLPAPGAPLPAVLLRFGRDLTAEAEAGTLGLMVGGAADDLEACRPVFETLAIDIVHCGPNGAGAAMKGVNNMLAGVVMAATLEAMVLGAKAGISTDTMLEVFGLSNAKNGSIDATIKPTVLTRAFQPAHFALDLLHKDTRLALELANEVGAAVPVAAVVQQLRSAARAKGRGRWDSAAIATIYEELADIELHAGR